MSFNIEHIQHNESDNIIKVDQTQLENYFDQKFFDDMKKWDIKVKKYENKYIFEQKDINSTSMDDDYNMVKKFYVEKRDFEKYIEKKEQLETTAIDSQSLLEQFFAMLQSKNNLWSLENNINNNVEWVKSDIEKINSMISKYKEYSKMKARDRANKTPEWRETLKDLIKESKYRVKILSWIKEDILKRKNKDVYLKDINQCEDDLPLFEQAWQKINLGETAHVPRLLHSQKDIKKYWAELQDEIIQDQRINAALKEIWLARLYQKDQERFRDYMEDVISGKIEHPENEQFYKDYYKDFLYIKNEDPDLYSKYSWFMEPSQIKWYCTTTVNWNPRMCNNPWSRPSLDYSNMDWWETFEKWWLKWLLRKWFDIFPNMKDGQKDTWTNIAFLWWLGFGLWKLGQWAFTGKFSKDQKEKTSIRWRIFAVWGTWLWSTALTGKNPIELISWLVTGWADFKWIYNGYKEALWGGSDVAKKYIEKPADANILFGGLTIKQLKEDIFDDKWNIDKRSLETIFKNTNEWSKLQTLKNSSEQDLKNWLSIIGIDFEDLNWLDENMTVEQYYVIYNNNIQTLWNYKSKYNIEWDELDVNDANIDKLISSGKEISNEDINNIFLQKIKLQKDDLSKKLSGINFAKKDELIVSAYNLTKLYGNKFELNLNSLENAKLNVHDQEIWINLNSLKMDWFDHSFSNIEDLIWAAKLTALIKEKFTWKKTAKNEYTLLDSSGPFHISGISQSIQFDDKEWYEVRKNETNVVYGNWFKNTLRNISPTLSEKKQEYVAYLNKWWKAEQSS